MLVCGSRCRAVAARLAHTQEVTGASPVTAINKGPTGFDISETAVRSQRVMAYHSGPEGNVKCEDIRRIQGEVDRSSPAESHPELPGQRPQLLPLDRVGHHARDCSERRADAETKGLPWWRRHSRPVSC